LFSPAVERARPVDWRRRFDSERPVHLWRWRRGWPGGWTPIRRRGRPIEGSRAGVLRVVFVDDAGGALTFRESPQYPGVLSEVLQGCQGRLLRPLVDDRHHADPQVEGATHFIEFNGATLGNHFEDPRPGS